MPVAFIQEASSIATIPGKQMHLNQALNGVRAFLVGLKFTSGSQDHLAGFTSFSLDELGGMTISGKEWNDYTECLDNLAEAVSRQGTFSRRGTERLFQTAILKAWNKNEAVESLPTNQVNRAVEWLRLELTAKPITYLVYLPVLGLDPSTLPLTIGYVTFLPGEGSSLEEIKKPVRELIKRSKSTESNKKSIRSYVVGHINNSFRNNIVAKLEVQAGDKDNAHAKALRECRRTLDCVNFYSDIFAARAQNACVSLLGENNQVIRLVKKAEKFRIIVIFKCKNITDSESGARKIAGFSCPTIARGPTFELKIPMLGSKQSVDSGFDYLSALLAKEDRTSLDERILAALQWAGRATVENRLEAAFLLYMIALESLVLGKDAKTEITYQLRLRLAHLIKSNVEDKKVLLKRLGDLYGIRSQIVHRGSFQVTDSEVREVRQYTKESLLTVLCDDPFKGMRSEEELEGWFQERLLL